jgi:hypothetical protein
MIEKLHKRIPSSEGEDSSVPRRSVIPLKNGILNWNLHLPPSRHPIPDTRYPIPNTCFFIQNQYRC